MNMSHGVEAVGSVPNKSGINPSHAEFGAGKKTAALNPAKLALSTPSDTVFPP